MHEKSCWWSSIEDTPENALINPGELLAGCCCPIIICVSTNVGGSCYNHPMLIIKLVYRWVV